MSTDFNGALSALKNGQKVARIGWNGHGMYAYLVKAASYPAQTEHARKQFGTLVPYRAYFALKTAQNDIACWTPNTSDILATDWTILED